MEKEINFATQETTEATNENEATSLDLGNDPETADIDSTAEDSQSVVESAEESKEEFMGDPEEESDEDPQDADSFMRLYEESLKSIKEGEVVSGEIVQVDKEYVLVDIGYKSEGQISIREFVDDEGNLAAKVGDKIEVLLERREDDEGVIRLSKEKAAKIKVWDTIREIYEKDGTVKGTILSRVKGGLSVDIGLQAFLPGSQVDLRPIRDMDSLVGMEHEFKIVKYNKRRGNIVLSRRAILEAERVTLKEKTLEIIEEGSVLRGIVKNITDYGLFIDLGGIDGLVHITDMSWGRVGHPSEMQKAGDEIEVKVLSFDKERERVSLGIKQLVPDPWSQVEKEYPIGTRITGRVVSLTDYGAFIEVEQGVEGLIHVSEMSWTKRVKHPSKVVNIGDEVKAIVLEIDQESKRISLGMKQVNPNPWTLLEERYPVGAVIRGQVRNMTDFGIFIGIEDGIDGLVHISDLSWTHRVKHPSEMFQKGDEVEAVVLNIDMESERFSLGIKQLHEDPWGRIPHVYPRGARVKGKVSKVTDFGAFIEIEPGIDGLCHVSEFSEDHVEDPKSFVKPGDDIEVMIIDIDSEDRKIGLSIKAVSQAEKGMDYRSYLAQSTPKKAKAASVASTSGASLGTFGDAFKGKFDSVDSTSDEAAE